MKPNEKLEKFLEENNLSIQVNLVVVSPLGDPVKPGNFIPQGWTLKPQIMVSNGEANISNGVPGVPVDAVVATGQA